MWTRTAVPLMTPSESDHPIGQLQFTLRAPLPGRSDCALAAMPDSARSRGHVFAALITTKYSLEVLPRRKGSACVRPRYSRRCQERTRPCRWTERQWRCRKCPQPGRAAVLSWADDGVPGAQAELRRSAKTFRCRVIADLRQPAATAGHAPKR
jgi:hypothetical protein